MSAMVTIILAALQAVEALLSATGLTSAAVTKVIGLLVQILPAIETEYETIVPYIKNIIAALQANSATTAEQLAQLETLDQQADQAFEAAATAAQAQDGAAS